MELMFAKANEMVEPGVEFIGTGFCITDPDGVQTLIDKLNNKAFKRTLDMSGNGTHGDWVEVEILYKRDDI